VPLRHARLHVFPAVLEKTARFAPLAVRQTAVESEFVSCRLAATTHIEQVCGVNDGAVRSVKEK
jgi:hypothetical protein